MGNKPHSVTETVCMYVYARENGFTTHMHIPNVLLQGAKVGNRSLVLHIAFIDIELH